MIHGTSKERSLDPPDYKECPEECGFLVDGECIGDPPDDCPDVQEQDEMDAKYEQARDSRMEDEWLRKDGVIA